MRSFVSRMTAIALSCTAAVALLACTANDEPRPTAEATRPAAETASSPVAQATPSDGVRRITIVELRNALEKGEAVLIDVRDESQYKSSHIKGARSIPLGEVARRADELPHDKLIVTYCA